MHSKPTEVRIVAAIPNSGPQEPSPALFKEEEIIENGSDPSTPPRRLGSQTSSAPSTLNEASSFEEGDENGGGGSPGSSTVSTGSPPRKALRLEQSFHPQTSSGMLTPPQETTEHGLSEDEFKKVLEILRRVPARVIAGETLTQDEIVLSKRYSQWSYLSLHAPSGMTDAILFSGLQTLPPKLPNEIEFCFKNSLGVQIGENVYSEFHEYNDMKYRILALHKARTPDGNMHDLPAANTLGIYVEVAPPYPNAEQWQYGNLEFHIVVVNQQDWRESIFRSGSWPPNECAPDRGYPSILPEYDAEKFFGPSRTLYIRAGIYPTAATFERAMGVPNYPMQAVGNRSGLINLGATCYLNSLLQTLNHVGLFCRGLFKATVMQDEEQQEDVTEESSDTDDALQEDCEGQSPKRDMQEDISIVSMDEDRKLLRRLQKSGDAYRRNKSDNSTVLAALQKLFFMMANSNAAVDTRELICSFGWKGSELYEQHDVQELNRLLCDRLETHLKGTDEEGIVQALFAGETEQVIECLNVNFVSRRRETFYDVQLDVQDVPSLKQALRRYVEDEVLDGDNCYIAEGHGKQAARKYIRFVRFPPIVQFHLKRFTFDMEVVEMVKIYDRFEFPTSINLSTFADGAGYYDLCGVVVHQGNVNSGHYYSFTKPTSGPWMRFDDETVNTVSKWAAVDDNFGGLCPRPWNYLLAPLASYQPKKLHSAYVLFYVRRDAPMMKENVPVGDITSYLRTLERSHRPPERLQYMSSRELLHACDPEEVNKPLAAGFRSASSRIRRRQQAEMENSKYIRLRIHTEESLVQSGVDDFTHTVIEPPLLVLKVLNTVHVYAVWRYICGLIQDGRLSGYNRDSPPALYWIDSHPYKKEEPTKGTRLWPLDFVVSGDSGWQPASVDRSYDAMKDDRKRMLGPLRSVDIVVVPNACLRWDEITRLRNTHPEVQLNKELDEKNSENIPYVVKLYFNPTTDQKDHRLSFIGFVLLGSTSNDHEKKSALLKEQVQVLLLKRGHSLRDYRLLMEESNDDMCSGDFKWKGWAVIVQPTRSDLLEAKNALTTWMSAACSTPVDEAPPPPPENCRRWEYVGDVIVDDMLAAGLTPTDRGEGTHVAKAGDDVDIADGSVNTGKKVFTGEPVLPLVTHRICYTPGQPDDPPFLPIFPCLTVKDAKQAKQNLVAVECHLIDILQAHGTWLGGNGQLMAEDGGLYGLGLRGVSPSVSRQQSDLLSPSGSFNGSNNLVRLHTTPVKTLQIVFDLRHPFVLVMRFIAHRFNVDPKFLTLHKVHPLVRDYGDHNAAPLSQHKESKLEKVLKEYSLGRSASDGVVLYFSVVPVPADDFFCQIREMSEASEQRPVWFLARLQYLSSSESIGCVLLPMFHRSNTEEALHATRTALVQHEKPFWSTRHKWTDFTKAQRLTLIQENRHGRLNRVSPEKSIHSLCTAQRNLACPLFVVPDDTQQTEEINGNARILRILHTANADRYVDLLSSPGEILVGPRDKLENVKEKIVPWLRICEDLAHRVRWFRLDLHDRVVPLKDSDPVCSPEDDKYMDDYIEQQKRGVIYSTSSLVIEYAYLRPASRKERGLVIKT